MEIAKQPHWIFPVDGEVISFDPPPRSGTIKLDDLPSIQEKICPKAKRFRFEYVNSPKRELVSALVPLPPASEAKVYDSPFHTGTEQAKALFVTFRNSLTIAATEFGSTRTRRLIVTDAGADIGLANVDLALLLTASSATVRPSADDHHKFLYCDLVEEDRALTEESAPAKPLKKSKAPKAIGLEPTEMFVDRMIATLGPGCSNSTWP